MVQSVGVPLDEELRELPVGKGTVIMDGDDLSIFALGKSSNAAVEAADKLAEFGISCAVVDPIYAKPLDTELILNEAHRTGRVLTVEENVLAGGFGSAVAEVLVDAGAVNVDIQRMGMPDAFVEHGTAADQRQQLKLDAEGIVDTVLDSFFPDVAARVQRDSEEDQGLAATA